MLSIIKAPSCVGVIETDAVSGVEPESTPLVACSNGTELTPVNDVEPPAALAPLELNVTLISFDPVEGAAK